MGRRLAVVLVALLVAGCGGQSDSPAMPIGAWPDSDSALLAHLYAAALRHYGTPTRVESTPDPLVGLDSGAVQVVPAFTGRLLHRFAPNSTARSAERVYRDLVAALPEGVVAGDFTESAQDKPAVVITEATVAAWGGDDVAAMARHCGDVSAGAVAGARDVPVTLGSCRLPRPREFADAATMFASLDGDLNAAWTTTAAPGTPDELVLLSDDTALIRAENVVPLYRRNELNESQVLALNQVAGVLDTAALAEIRRQVADGQDPAAVADAWLAAHPLGRS